VGLEVGDQSARIGFQRLINWAGAVCEGAQTGLNHARWRAMGQGRVRPDKGKTPTAVSRVLSSGDVIYADPLNLEGWLGRRGPVPAASIAGGVRPSGRDGSMDRPGAGDGWRLLVRPEPVSTERRRPIGSRDRPSNPSSNASAIRQRLYASTMEADPRLKSIRGRAVACAAGELFGRKNITGDHAA